MDDLFKAGDLVTPYLVLNNIRGVNQNKPFIDNGVALLEVMENQRLRDFSNSNFPFDTFTMKFRIVISNNPADSQKSQRVDSIGHWWAGRFHKV